MIAHCGCERCRQTEASYVALDRMLKEKELQKSEYLDHLEMAWSIIASAGMAGNIGNWKLLDPIWVEAAEKWRDKWHEILRKRKESV